MPTLETAAVDTSRVPSGRHNPEGRRRQIVIAAAELIPRVGLSKLTHRLVAEQAGVSLGSTTRYFTSIDELKSAALQQMAELVEQEVAEMRAMVEREGCTPATLAKDLHQFLSDPDLVRINTELYAAANTDQRLRAFANHWNNGLIELLLPHIGETAAQGVALIMDGATAHASINDEPLGQDVLEHLLTVMFDSANERP